MAKETFCKQIVVWGKKMAKQRSTWRGLVMLSTAVGVQVSPEAAEAIVSMGMAVLGADHVVQDETAQK